MSFGFGISVLIIIGLVVSLGWSEFKLKVSSKLVELELSANNTDSNK